MKTRFLLPTLFAVFAVAAVANAQSGLPCGTTDFNDRLKQQHPAEVQQAEDQLRSETENLLQHGEGRSTSTYVIPVVFHIIHDYGTENISDAQVLDEMAILNRDYAKLNPDTTNIIPEFMGVASAADIEFRLATIDPEGNCTNGIERIASKKTNQADDASKLNPWPREKYLNVWVVKTIGASGVAGYAYYPSAVVGLGLAIDGVIILHDYIGSIGTGSVGTSRALTHEIGHYLNLAHCWGSTNSPGVACGDDGIPDTPKTKGWDHCPTAAQAKVCDTAIVENYQNYMEYSYCSNMFTHDQVIAMHATLNSNVSDRNHLWRPDNLVATGTATTTASSCAPNADFHGNRRMVCPGGTITYTDDSWNGTVSSRIWTFDGGTPATSTAANPTVTYNTPGIYTTTLMVTNAQGTDTKVKTGYVIIGTGYGLPGPVSESFENGDPLQQGWTAINYNEDNIHWRSVNMAGSTGSSCMMIDNYYNDRGEVDELITPAYDLRYLTGMQLTFKSSFASKVQDTSLLDDRLRVFISSNCGQTWQQIYIRTGAQLVSSGQVPTPFVPGYDPSLWRAFSVNVSSVWAQSHVMFKFEWTGSKYGNHFFLDDINVSGGTVGIAEHGENTSMEVFPNPAQDNANVSVNLASEQYVKITLTDLNGRLVKMISNEKMPQGQQLVSFSTADLAEGLYLVTVDDGLTKQVKKLAVHH